MPHVVGLGINVGGLQLGSSSSLSVARKEVLSLASSDIIERGLGPPQSSRRTLRRRHGVTWSRSRSRLLHNSHATLESSLPVLDLSPPPVHPMYHSTIYLPLSSSTSSPVLPLSPPSTFHLRADSHDRVNNNQQNGPFFGLAVGLSVLCGVLVLGLSGSGIFAYYSRRKRNRRLVEAKKEKDRVARASFESRGGIGGHGRAAFHPTDRRSDWLRQGLESPHLVLPERAKSRNPYSSKSASPPPSNKGKSVPKSMSRLVVDEKTLDAKTKDLTVPETRAKHTFSPAMPSPLGIRPVWTVPHIPSGDLGLSLGSDSDASFEFDASPPNFRKLVALNASPPSSSPSVDTVAIDNTDLDDQKPTTIPSVSPRNEALDRIIIVKESGNSQTQIQATSDEAKTHSISSVETSNSLPTTASVGSLSADTHFTGMSSLSHDHHTDETLLHEDAPWTAPIYAQGCAEDSFGTLYVPLAPSSSSGHGLNAKDPHISSSVDSDNVQPSLKPSVSLPVPLAPSSPSIASSTNFIFPSSTDSTFFSMHMMLLKDAPLPPPTIMVSTPTNASLRTRALAAFQMGSLLVDAWDDGSEDEDDEAGSPEDLREDEESGRWAWAPRGLASTVLHSKPSVQAQLPALTKQSAHTSVLVPVRNSPSHEVSKPKVRAMESGKENAMPYHSLHNRSASDSFAPRSIPSIANASHRPTSIPVLSSLRISRLL